MAHYSNKRHIHLKENNKNVGTLIKQKTCTPHLKNNSNVGTLFKQKMHTSQGEQQECGHIIQAKDTNTHQGEQQNIQETRTTKRIEKTRKSNWNILKRVVSRPKFLKVIFLLYRLTKGQKVNKK